MLPVASQVIHNAMIQLMVMVALMTTVVMPTRAVSKTTAINLQMVHNENTSGNKD
jgi:hypothetical protein